MATTPACAGSVSAKRLNKMLELGYQFKDSRLLDQALTHRSAADINNERLEFLGDAALGLVIAELLYQRFPQAPEGTLSRMRAHLVNGEQLASVAKTLNLGPHLKLGPGEKRSGGHQRNSILADALEAILGAIFLESGLDACRECIIRWYGNVLTELKTDASRKDDKTRLQEALQARQAALPTYSIKSIEGKTHAQTFYVECSVEGFDHSSHGSGSSRRKAEQVAAQAFLTWLNQHG